MITHARGLGLASTAQRTGAGRFSALCSLTLTRRQQRTLAAPLRPTTSCNVPSVTAARASAGMAVVAFADSDAADDVASATATQTADVQFQITRNLPFGSHMCVVGDAPELGTWKVKSARAMRWNTGDVWTLSLPLPPGNYNWKHMVQHQGSEEWERGGDRDLVVSTADAVITVESAWGKADEMLVTVSGVDDSNRVDGSSSSSAKSSSLEDEPAATAAAAAGAPASSPAADGNGTFGMEAKDLSAAVDRAAPGGMSVEQAALLQSFERYQQLVAGALQGAVSGLEGVQRELEQAAASTTALSTDAAGAAGAAGALLGAGAPAAQDAAALARALAGVVQLKGQLLEWQQRSDALLAAGGSDAAAAAGAADMEEGKALRLGLMLQRLAASAEAPRGTGQTRKGRRASATTSAAPAAPAASATSAVPLGEELAGQVAPAITLAGPAAPAADAAPEHPAVDHPAAEHPAALGDELAGQVAQAITLGGPAAPAADGVAEHPAAAHPAAEHPPALGDELAGQVAQAITLAGPAAPAADGTAAHPAAQSLAALRARRASARARSKMLDASDASSGDAAPAAPAEEEGAGAAGKAPGVRRMRRTSRGATSMMSAAGGTEAYVERLLAHRHTEQFFKGLVCCSMLALGLWRPGFEKLMEGTLLKDVWRQYLEQWPNSRYIQTVKKNYTTPAALLDDALTGTGALALTALWGMAQVGGTMPDVADVLSEQGMPLSVDPAGATDDSTLAECRELFGAVRAKAVAEGRAAWV